MSDYYCLFICFEKLVEIGSRFGLGRTGHVGVENVAFGIDQDETGNGADLVEVGKGVVREVELITLHLTSHLLPVAEILIHREGNECDVLVLEVFHHLLEIGNLTTARAAPGGPNVNIDISAAEFLQCVRLAIEIGSGE